MKEVRLSRAVVILGVITFFVLLIAVGLLAYKYFSGQSPSPQATQYAAYAKDAIDALIVIDYKISIVGLTQSEYNAALNICVDKIAILVSKFPNEQLTKTAETALGHLRVARDVWHLYGDNLHSQRDIDDLKGAVEHYHIPTQPGVWGTTLMVPFDLMQAAWVQAHIAIEQAKTEAP